MAMIWWLDYIKCNLLLFVFISQLLILSEAITLKYIVANTTSYVQSCLLKCFVVYLFSYCSKILEKKLPDYSNIQFTYQMGHAPFRSSIYTITRSSKIRSIDSLLQHTGKCH